LAVAAADTAAVTADLVPALAHPKARYARPASSDPPLPLLLLEAASNSPTSPKASAASSSPASSHLRRFPMAVSAYMAAPHDSDTVLEDL